MSAPPSGTWAGPLPKQTWLVCPPIPAPGTVSGTTQSPKPQASLTWRTLQLAGAPLALAGLAAGPAEPPAAGPAVRAAHTPAPPPQLHPGPALVAASATSLDLNLTTDRAAWVYYAAAPAAAMGQLAGR